MRKRLSIPPLIVYTLSAFAFLFLFYVGDHGEPFGLALFYALGITGASPVLSAVFYLLTSLLSFNLTTFLLYLAQGLFVCVAFLIERRINQQRQKPTVLLSLSSVFLSLTAYVFLSPFSPYPLPFFPILYNYWVQKVGVAALIFLLSATFSVSLKALFFKLLRCRFQANELIYCALLFILLGVGFCRFFGYNAYMGACFFLLLLFAAVTKDSSTLCFSFVLSIPPFLVFDLSIARIFLYAVAVVFFIKAGRLAATLSFLALFFILGYFDGLYSLSSLELTRSILSIVIPCLLFIVCPTALIRRMENELIFYREKYLSRLAVNRNRAAVGEQLFEIASVFREIQTTFVALNDSSADENAKGYVLASVTETTCKRCPNKSVCHKKNVKNALMKLIDVGCVKGKVNFIDVPTALADQCVQQTELLTAVNKQIADYRRYMAEAENAANGRNLLANQALGVSEILKNIAVEQSAPLKSYTDKEKALTVALQRSGIVCSEILILGDKTDFTLSLVTYGDADVKKIAAVASELLGLDLIAAEKLTLSKDKFCCIFHRRPKYDAAFGIATRTKEGERKSGDTHSVIKIDERRFLVALADGMGSGDYASKVSESTISLLESFYRAKMPSPLVLNTVNKLLSFNREESFACVDIAVVDLDDGRADVVKIGSPMGFILSANSLKILEGSSLPLGILDSLHPATSAYALHANDVLLFLSDGITQAFPSTVDLYELLKSVPISNPQRLADDLLNTAIELYGGEAKDDMTVLAVRLFKNVA